MMNIFTTATLHRTLRDQRGELLPAHRRHNIHHFCRTIARQATTGDPAVWKITIKCILYRVSESEDWVQWTQH
jgi:hypothetical protein